MKGMHIICIAVAIILLLMSALVDRFSYVIFDISDRKDGAGFDDVSDELGISDIGGMGTAWADYDNDGYLDFFFLRLYHNNGDGTFTSPPYYKGVRNQGEAIATAFADYNNDSCSDLYISRHGEQVLDGPGTSDSLYRNNCDGTFTEVTEEVGMGDSSHAYGVAWADYNRDGNVDLYVANWGVTTSEYVTTSNYLEYTLETNFLYRNNGDGTFTDVAEEAHVLGFAQCKNLDAGTQKMLALRKHSYQPIWFDYNNDREIDLFVATDTYVSPLYRNNGDGTFTDVTEAAGLCRLGTGMGVTVGDYNSSGYLDIYVTNTVKNYLWRNNGDGTFTEMAEHAGVADRGQGWGTHFFDFNNDGELDLYVVNGTNLGVLDTRGIKPNNHDELFSNNGDGTFTRVTESMGIHGNEIKKGASFADYNNDGFVDIFVFPISSPEQIVMRNRFYRNSWNGNHWLTIKLVGVISNRDGIGARIILKEGSRSQIREVISGSSFLSQNSPWPTFGVGSATSIDVVEIIWPSGTRQILQDVKVDQILTIIEQ